VPDSYLPGVHFLAFLPNSLILLLMCWKMLELIMPRYYMHIWWKASLIFFLNVIYKIFLYSKFFVSSSHVFAVKLLIDYQVYFHQHFFAFEFQHCIGLHVVKWSSFVCTIDSFNHNHFYIPLKHISCAVFESAEMACPLTFA